MNRSTRERQLQQALTQLLQTYDQEGKGYLLRGEVYALLSDGLADWEMDASQLERVADVVDRLDDAFDGKITKEAVSVIVRGLVEKKLFGE